MEKKQDFTGRVNSARLRLDNHFRSGATRGLANRLQALRAIKNWLIRHNTALLEALKDDLSKPQSESYLSELYFTHEEIRYFLHHLPKWIRPRRVPTPFFNWPGRSWIAYEPKGVALIIAPWNYPLNLTLAPAIAAISAGNPVILKPSEWAPATAELLQTLNLEPDLKPWLEVILGDADTTQRLLERPWAHILFTGGSKVGRIVAEAAGRTLTPTTLELGGKNPAILHTDADLQSAALRIVHAKCFNAGQTCLAPDFVLVPESSAPLFIELCQQALRRFFPSLSDWQCDSSRIISPHHFARLLALSTGNRWQLYDHQEADLKFAPTLLINPPASHPALQEEIFGPLLPIVSYQDLEPWLQHLSRQPTPLALYPFARSNSWIDQLVARLPSGGVCINDCIQQITNFELPFGGQGGSGYGRYRGFAGFTEFSNLRSYLKHGTWTQWSALWPPYANSFEKLKRYCPLKK